MAATIEERVAALEKEVAQLKYEHDVTSGIKKPWWELHVGAFKVLSETTGYPGPIGDYGECAKVRKASPPAARATNTFCKT